MSKYAMFDTKYQESSIETLPYGKRSAKLGLLCESYVCDILNNKEFFKMYRKNTGSDNVEYQLFCEIIKKLPWNARLRLIASTKVPRRKNGSAPKSDIVIGNLFHKCGISIKQSISNKVSSAEFAADVFIEDVGIEDKRANELIRKHQKDGSAKNFTKEEKEYLTNSLKPYVNKIVRWVVTGSSVKTKDIRNPEIVIRFKMNRNGYPVSYTVRDTDEEMDAIIYNKKSKQKKSGFGTGLSWTRASGSGTSKIQFKI